MTKQEEDAIDWSLTTWEGSRREQLRRWSLLTLDEIFDAQEEMAEIAAEWGAAGEQQMTANHFPPVQNQHP